MRLFPCLFTCMLMLLAGALPAAPAATRTKFDLPAAPAERGLKLFSEQSGLEVLFSTDAVSQVRTNAVQGELTPLEAMTQLLRGTPLQAKRDERTGAFAVRPTALPRTGSGESVPPRKNAANDEPTLTRAQRAEISGASRPAAPMGRSTASDEVVELSPFQVTADEDSGYQATSTLGGTRLRTDLRDLAASISVVTKEMMEDLGVTSLEQMLNYTLGTEVEGYQGNYSDATAVGDFDTGEGSLRSSQSIIRVRGLAIPGGGGADVTQDYFLTDIRSDRYNVDRVEVQQGPNGMLFGLGSPQGVVNRSLIKANTRRTSTRVDTQFGSYGSYRTALDLNQVLVKDRLALRVAGLYGDAKYRLDSAHNFSRRAYLTTTWRPFSTTTLKVSSEHGISKNTNPRNLPPIDSFSYWWAIGKPVYDPITGLTSYLGTPPTDPNLAPANSAGAAINGYFGTPGGNINVVVENPNAAVFGVSIPGNPQAMEANQVRVRRNPANTAWVNDSMRSLGRSNNYLRRLYGTAATDPRYNYWKSGTVVDPAIFDVFTDTLDGPTRYENFSWHTFNVSLEQRLGRNAGVELAYDRQTLDTAYQNHLPFSEYRISLDISTKLLNGAPNPNFGRPMVAGQLEQGTINPRREAVRATAYYDLDLAKHFGPESRLGKILGRHTFTGNFSDQRRERTTGKRYNSTGLDYWAEEQLQNAGTTGVLSKLTSGIRRIRLMEYVGPSLVGSSAPQGQGIQGVKADVSLDHLQRLSTLFYPNPTANATVPGVWRIQPFDINVRPSEWANDYLGFEYTSVKEVYKSVTGVAQSRWFENKLVSTVGWRRDDFRTYDAGGPAFDDNGYAILDPRVYYPKIQVDDSVSTTNYGVVGHAPEWLKRRLPRGVDLSVSYNHSDNFRPEARRVNVYNEELEPTSGQTKEYGVALSLFDRKLELRASNFKTSIVNGMNNTLFSVLNDIATTPIAIINRVADGQLQTNVDGSDASAAVAAWKSFVQTAFQPVVGAYQISIDANGHATRTVTGQSTVVDTSDLVARGLGFDVIYNPTRNWRMAVNLSKAQTVTDKSGRGLLRLFATWRPLLLDGKAGDLQTTDTSDFTVSDWFIQKQNQLATVTALDGSISPQQRKWRANYVTNYSFTRGALKDWNVGGSVRWQDKVAIGYPVKRLASGDVQYDVSRPFFGQTEANYDAWVGYRRRILSDRIAWRAQLNVRNIGVDRKLIAIGAQPDGSVASWRIAEPMTWSFSNSFEF